MDRRRLLETMARIVAADEALSARLERGEIAITYYSPRGQEAVAAGAASALRADDWLVATYRGIHDQLAKGVPLEPLFAEYFGRVGGTGKGKGGPMHIVWPEAGLMCSTGVVGSGLPIAVGLGWAAQREGSGRIVLCSFGDGAADIGAFHEACNVASLWELPVVFLCQNNGYAEHTAFAAHTRSTSVAERAAAYAMPGVQVDGLDPERVHDAVAEAAERARAGDGPTLVEARCVRLRGHVFGDPMTYIAADERDRAWAADPYLAYAARLMADDVLSAEDVAAVQQDARGDVEHAITAALAQPEPDHAELFADVTGPST